MRKFETFCSFFMGDQYYIVTFCYISIKKHVKFEFHSILLPILHCLVGEIRDICRTPPFYPHERLDEILLTYPNPFNTLHNL